MNERSVDFSSSALPALDALSSTDQKRVLTATKELAAGADRALMPLRTGDQESASLLYALRAGSDLRLLVQRKGDGWLVLDIIRKSAMSHLPGGKRR